MDRRKFLTVAGLSPLAALTLTGTAQAAPGARPAGAARHTFGFAADGSEFLLDGEPLQIRSAEIHPARVPVEYWRHRILMAKAMGLNTISVYDFWNYHEVRKGHFDFRTERRNLARFIRIAQSEGMWVLLRPGPYVCGEWDLGGLPSYLLADPDAQLRVRHAAYPPYLDAFRRYARALAEQVRPLMVANGGPILMVQVENEYGSYGNDATYVAEIRQTWIDNGLTGPFYTEDGLGQVQGNHTNVPGGAIALSGGDVNSIAAARESFPAVPAMSGELYSGWLTHWGDRSFASGVVTTQVAALMQQKKSFNFYMFHGGTSFGFWSGANADGDGSNYGPDITSYDYGSPVTEQGVATDLYQQYREIITTSSGLPVPPVPAAPPTITPATVTAIPYASLWDNLPRAVATGERNPRPMEAHGQDFGLVLYRAKLRHHTGGDLTVTSVHDYATVFLDGAYQGGLTRTAIAPAFTGPIKVLVGDGPLALAAGSGPTSALDILVEGMGRINYGHGMVDRKGITSSVAVEAGDGSGTDIRGWTTHLLPLTASWFRKLRTKISDPSRPGQVFRAEFTVDELGDTYLDMSQWTKGLVFVNGHNLGRYWNVGPQLALFCPAGFLRRGTNTIQVLDLHRTEQAPIAFVAALDDVDLPGRGGTVYTITHQASGMALGITGGSQTPGARATIATPSGESWQQWEVVDLGTGYSTVLNRHSGMALDDLDHKKDPGSPVGQWADGGGINQQWELTRGGDASYSIRNRESGLYLTAVAATDGAPVTQEALTGASSRWMLTEL